MPLEGGEGGALSESLYCAIHIYYDFTNKNNQFWGSIEYLYEDLPSRGNLGGLNTPHPILLQGKNFSLRT